MDIDLDHRKMYQCAECEAFAEDESEEKKYECGSCGTEFTRDNSADGDSNRCPDCNKFAGKLYDNTCPECEDGEQEPVECVSCPWCHEDFRDDDFEEHLDEEHEDEPEYAEALAIIRTMLGLAPDAPKKERIPDSFLVPGKHGLHRNIIIVKVTRRPTPNITIAGHEPVMSDRYLDFAKDVNEFENRKRREKMGEIFFYSMGNIEVRFLLQSERQEFTDFLDTYDCTYTVSEEVVRVQK